MARYFIEVPHEAEKGACARAVQIFLRSGSHFVANADWGCKAGDHRALLIVDLASQEEARNILPPAFRARAKVVELNKFSLQDIEPWLLHHKG